ncbi:Gag pol protein [Elysia marginata]|uniref:Gag pol protein n=1 Tax=Elysia marginata TaxID=1093978 RepID=A0AAV4G847_9GAST|nr:Gag pol protein [Elysia marginata]
MAKRALSVLTSPPPKDKYNAIKTFLLSACRLTDGEVGTALLNMRGIVDSKPSELMDNMLSLLGQHQTYFLFRQIFLKQMPEHVRTPLPVLDYRNSCPRSRQAVPDHRYQHIRCPPKRSHRTGAKDRRNLLILSKVL